MLRTLAAAVLLASASSASAQVTPLRAPVAESGTHEGAPYRIDVPANWNGGLVVLFHGYRLASQPFEMPFRGEGATQVFTQRGFAVIQSAYSRQGWAVAEARADTRRLRTLFEQRFGRPRRAFAAGFSMGGHLALATIEQEADRYDGALTLCGVNVPATAMFDRAVADLAAADALFPGIIPDPSAPGSPDMFDGDALQRAMTANPDATARLAAWAGVRADNVPGVIWFFYMAVRELRDRAGGLSGGNASVRYSGFGDDAAFNARVRRYRPDAAGLRYMQANATLTGALRDPVVLLDNDYDDLVSGKTRAFYPAAVRQRGARRWLTVLPPEGQGHCRFTGEQIGAAFDRLVQAAGRRR